MNTKPRTHKHPSRGVLSKRYSKNMQQIYRRTFIFFNFIKKETLAQVFSCKCCKISKNTFSYRPPPGAASEIVMTFGKKKFTNGPFKSELYSVTCQTSKMLKIVKNS